MGYFGNAFAVMTGILNVSSRVTMVTASAISSGIKKARTKKEIKMLMQQAEDTNRTNRAVITMPYANSAQLLLTSGEDYDNDLYLLNIQSAHPALDYIWGKSDAPESVIVSGGEQHDRTNGLMPFVRKLQNAGIPIVVLHKGNADIEAMLQNNSSIQARYGNGKLYYDMFRGMPAEDVASVLYETMPESTSPCAESLIRAVMEVLFLKTGTATFDDLASYPLVNLMDDLNTLYNTGSVTAAEFKDISRDYMAGSAEIDSVRSFLNKLNRQMRHVFGMPGRSSQNIKKILNQKGIASFDMGTGGNELAVSLLLNQLLYYQESGKSFALLIDDISPAKFYQMSSLLQNCIFGISSADFIASLSGGEKRADEWFTELTGNVGAVVLFGHKSGTTCQKWSDHIGKYHKIKISMTISQSEAFLMGSSNHGVSVQETDEPRVRAQTLSMLPEAVACIHRPDGTLIAEVEETAGL